MHLRMWSLLLATMLFSNSLAAADSYHRSTLPITKIEARQLPEDAVVHQILGQVSDLLLTTPAFLPDKNYSEIDGASKQKIFDELFKIVQSYPGGDPALTGPSLNEASVTEVLRRLGQIMTIWPDPFVSTHPRFPLSQITFETRPHASAISDLCIREDVTVFFRPVAAISGPYTRVAASDAQVERYYYFLALPARADAEFASNDKMKRTDEACAQLDAEKEIFLSASDELQANRGTWLADTVQSQLRASSIPFVVHCKLFRTKTVEGCLNKIGALPQRVWSVSDCKPGGDTCAVSLSGGFEFVIAMRRSSDLAVDSLDIDHPIIIADPIAD